MLNITLECHVAGPYALSYEVSTYIYIYILIFKILKIKIIVWEIISIFEI